jgi:hypothetical protein
MAAKIEKATNSVIKMLVKVDDFLLEFGTKIL